MGSHESLLAIVRANRDRIAIVRDDIPLTGERILYAACDLANTLRTMECRRAAGVFDGPDEIATALCAGEEAGCQMVLLRAGHGNSTEELLRQLRPDVVIEPGLAAVPWPDAGDQTDQAGGHEAEVLLATSGTSGTTKFARHDIASLLGRVRRRRDGEAGAVWLMAYHPASFAGLQVLLTVLVNGDRLVTCSSGALTDLVRAAFDHGVTHISATPSFWCNFLLQIGERSDTLDLKRVTLGGEAVRQDLIDTLRDRFPGAAIAHIYASNEAGALFSVRDGREGFPAAWLDGGIDGVELRIRDGVLEVRSPRAMRGYALGGKPVLGGDNWLRTGDQVERKEDRVVFIGREDGVINVGGLKVNPEKVERILEIDSAVIAARAFGVTSPITGNLVAAEIVAVDNVDRAMLQARLQRAAKQALAAHEVPRVFRFVDTISVTDTGKKLRAS